MKGFVNDTIGQEERGTDYPFARTVSFSLSLRF